ncbi:MAG: hypothetical protein DHS20C15_19750 [Planctomycetota bacterium]|nr:MAG: hypothetical protein DHS20C15_19750 [Planctomycetota bacterium]
MVASGAKKSAAPEASEARAVSEALEGTEALAAWSLFATAVTPRATVVLGELDGSDIGAVNSAKWRRTHDQADECPIGAGMGLPKKFPKSTSGDEAV